MVCLLEESLSLHSYLGQTLLYRPNSWYQKLTESVAACRHFGKCCLLNKFYLLTNQIAKKIVGSIDGHSVKCF
jgi:hypothetical protein